MNLRSRRRFVSGASAFAGLVLAGDVRLVSAQSPPPVRQRKEIRDCHLDEISALSRAVATMMDTRVGGTTAWEMNATTHANVCGHADPASAIHQTVFFYPWHRGFLRALELNLQAAGDPSIMLPYWQWSTDAANGFVPIPTAFESGSLAHPRNVSRLHTSDIDVSTLNSAGYQFMTTWDGGFDVAFGGYQYSQQPTPGPYNVLEGSVHAAVHNKVGGDMGDIAWSPRDPLFFGHHGNLDRLWEVWRGLKMPDGVTPRGSTEPWNQAAFTNKSWTYYRFGSATPWTFTMQDLRNTENLGYTYAPPRNGQSSLEVMNYLPGHPSQHAQHQPALSAAEFGPPLAFGPAERLQRPAHPSLSPAHAAVLAIACGELPSGFSTSASIFLSDEASGSFRVGHSVFAGTLGVVQTHHPVIASFAFDVSAALARLRPKGQIRVTLLPYKDDLHASPLPVRSFKIIS